MSEMERNNGKLIHVDFDTDNLTEDEIEDLWGNGFVQIDFEWYAVEYEVERDMDCYDFADVKCNDDGTIDFHTYHYNGGCHWSEVVENELERQFKEKK